MEKVWKPFRKQEAFLSIPDTIFEGMYGGAAGGGKSDALLMIPIVRSFYKNPNFKGIVFRRTYPELESEIILRSNNWYPHVGGTYNSEKRRWSFNKIGGGYISFGHMEYESDARKYDTTEYNYMAFDELTSFTEFQYKYLALSRCRSSSRDLPAIVRSATNPGNVGHSWVRKYFIEPAPYGHIILDKVTKLKRIFIQALVTDNPHIDPGYIDRLSALPEAERRAKRDGDWYTFEGQVFDDWRENRFPDEPENAVHVIEPFDVPDWWIRILAIDWGYSANTVALWGAISPDDRLYIYREFYCKQTKINSWATTVGNLSRNEKIEDIVMCQSAWQNRGDEKNIAEQFERYSGLRPRLADNARIAGKVMIQEYLRWRARPESKMLNTSEFDSSLSAAILRNRGIEAYKGYLESFSPEEPETNLPRLQVFNTCSGLKNCIPLCIYAKNDSNGKPAEDVREFDGDDFYDCLRYLLMSAEYNMGRLKETSKEREKVNRVIEEFQRTRDWTTYMRGLEKIDGEVTEFTPVRRFHRGSRVA